ncbi:hypothetical protein HRG_014195 [Hirsutella rhossiliensis]
MGLTEFPDDCLPPEGQFDSRESLLASINAWAAPFGNLSSAGIAPKDIRTYMRQSSQTAQGATQQDIYNCIAQRRRELLAGQSTMHALANELDNEGSRAAYSLIMMAESQQSYSHTSVSRIPQRIPRITTARLHIQDEQI